MRIRDSFATINGSDEEYEMPSGGLEILADDGRTLFCITLRGSILSIDAGSVCKHEEKTLDDRFLIEPVAANVVRLIKRIYPE